MKFSNSKAPFRNEVGIDASKIGFATTLGPGGHCNCHGQKNQPAPGRTAAVTIPVL
jgi:hypothetical protein